MASVFKVAGSVVDLTALNIIPISCVVWTRDGTQTMTLQKRGLPLSGLPDPWLFKTITWENPSGTLRFSGHVTTAAPVFNQKLGWVLEYQCLGLRWVGDKVPVTDDNTGIDPIRYNLDASDPNYIAARAGRNVGQIITDVLTMTTNSTRLSALGIGNYSGGALPSATVTDLAALTTIPPWPVTIGGQKILSALEGFLASAAPNHVLWVQPDGTIRVYDLRAFTPQTLTMGVDPIRPPSLARDTKVNFARVVVRGQPRIVPMVVSTVDGTLLENFAHDSLSNSAAKAAWVRADYLQTQTAADFGTCTVTDSTHIVVTSSDATATWSSNFWDQTSSGKHGVVYLTYPAGSGVNQMFSSPIIANTSLSAGGTSTLTLGVALPITSYNTYKIYGLQSGASIVWRNYKVADTTVGSKMQRQFPYPVSFRNSDGTSGTLTSFPSSTILWSGSGSAPYFESPMGFTQNPDAGTILFDRPTVFLTEPDTNKLDTAGGYNTPYDVRVLLAIAVDALTSTQPPDSGGSPTYTGTCNSVEGNTNTLYVTVPSWRDFSNQSNMDTYASDLLDSVKDTIVEGSLEYLGLFTDALTPGVAINVAGNNGSSYTTGWESLDLPITETVVHWPQDEGVLFRTDVRLSNRRAQYTSELFLRPNIVGQPLGANVGGFAIPPAAQAVLQALGIPGLNGDAKVTEAL